ncbi:MAG: InlB B-repeat-containing protein, partial [Oscillospiraceae bacterium]|nr:InlB B-repeat-containing protein [Oscillospiraceae bacterium]
LYNKEWRGKTFTVITPCMITVRNGKIGDSTSASVAPGTEVTVTANNAPEGKTFSYWMDGNGRRVSTDSTYTFTPTADTTVTAVFSTASTVNVTGGMVTKKNGTALGTPTDSISVVNGQSVTVTADAPADGKEFIGWYYVNGNGKIVSSSTEYTFTVVSDVKLEARYQQTSGVVTFVSYSSVQGTFTGTEINQEQFPADPSPAAGYMFTGWNKTVEEINQELKTGNVTVTAQFEIIANDITLDVFNGESSEAVRTVYDNSQWVTLTAEEVAGKNFSHWTVTVNGKNESINNKTINYYLTKDTTITAVYSTNVYVPRGTATISSAGYNPGTKKTTFVVYINVPQGCTIVRGGLVAVKHGDVFDGTGELTTANADFVKTPADMVGKCGNITYTWNKTKVEIGDTWYARAYLVYIDTNGEEQTVYGELVSVTA